MLDQCGTINSLDFIIYLEAKLKCVDAVKEDMQVVGVRVEDTKNRLKWKTVIRVATPEKGKAVRRSRRG